MLKIPTAIGFSAQRRPLDSNFWKPAVGHGHFGLVRERQACIALASLLLACER